jgi:membrane-bound serine protease (ClpP class)
MIHHPIVLGTKLVFLIVILVVLLGLHAILTPDQFRIAVVVAAVVFVVGVIALWVVAFKVLCNPNSKLGRQMILSREACTEDGYVASPDRFGSMVGACGVAVSPLRPAGTALFGETRVSVITEGEFIDTGTRVEIASARGSRVVVRMVSPRHNQDQAEG